jgi:hypothetical protein
VTVSFTVDLAEEQGGGISALTVGAIVIVIAALIAVALLLRARRKPTLIPGPEKEQVKKP